MRPFRITKNITVREAASLEKYLLEIRYIDQITPEEEVLLAVRIKHGDAYALHKLVKANLRFVVSVAKQYQNNGLSLSDLINEGNLGLTKAAQRFDETRGFKFISYAVWWIRQSILQALAEQGRIVKLPMNKVGLSNKISKAYSQLEQEHEREPSVEEMAELLDIGTEEVGATLGIGAKHVSIDAPFSDSEESTMIDVLENPNADQSDAGLYHGESLRTEIELSLNRLKERQRDVIKLYFGIEVESPMSIDDIAKRFSISAATVWKILHKGLYRLRTAKNYYQLKSYLA